MADNTSKDLITNNKDDIKYADHDGRLTTDAHDKPYMEMVLKGGEHSPLVHRILKQRIEARAKEFPRWPASQSGGTRVLWIESRFWYDRERLSPDFDDDWRNYRVKYLRSLELDPREPVHVPEWETYNLNPIRRFYMKGGDLVESVFRKVFKQDKWNAAANRVVTTRFFIGYLCFLGVYYHARYNYKNWTSKEGIELSQPHPVVYPDDPRYPYKQPQTHPAHFNDMGFTSRSIFKDLRDFETTLVAI